MAEPRHGRYYAQELMMGQDANITAELIRVDPGASNQRERTSLPHLLS
jgi:hypothetical protein